MELDSRTSFAERSLQEQGRENEELLARSLPYITALDDQSILLRDGDVMASFAVDGLSASTADDVEVGEISAAFSSLVAQQMPDVGFYVHRISTRTSPTVDRVSENNPFAAAVDQRWQGFIGVVGLRLRTTLVTITIRPSKVMGIWAKMSGGRKQKEEALQKRIVRLNQIVSAIMETLAKTNPRRMTISGGEWLGLLRTTISGIYDPLIPGRSFTPLNDLIANASISFQGDTFTVFGTHSRNTKYGAIVTLKDYPGETFAGILDSLDLATDMVVTNSFTPGDRVEALQKIQRVARQMAAAEDAARSLQDQLSYAADDQASGRVAFGNHHCTISVFADSDNELDETLGAITRAITSVGGSMVRENFAARAAFFAQQPGNYSYRSRASMISSQNFADLGALHGAARGRKKERSPWGEAITILPTGNGEPYRFNFHLSGQKDERTVGHSLILGQTGSGKTLGTAFLLAQAARLNPRIIVFDKDHGFEMPIRALGGDYTAVKMGQNTGFNPFEAESDERGAAWLTDWLEAMLKPKDGELTPVQIEALAKATRNNSKAAKNLQTIGHFRSQLRAVDDGKDLHTRLGRWDKGGQFDWLFNGEGKDSLSFANDIVAFDLSEIFDNDDVRTAWLSYVFRRIERIVEDERPTLLVMDEAWKLLDDPYFQSRLKDWMLTMRKKNVAVILLTQRVSHITESAAGGAIIESVVTRLIYPSNRNSAEELAPLNLTDRERDFLMQSNVGHRLALMQSGDDSTIIDMDLHALGPLVAVLGGGKGEAAPAGWRNKTEFWKDITK
ncbi:MAG: type IV secretion system DNA-binding domain-containing protein [Gammaproteobacteria bacterium]|nr:type IV secretion system DNA-binding domain-containing protein [Gammaproteobacteria bacterium]